MRLLVTISVVLTLTGAVFGQTPDTGKVVQFQYPRYGFSLSLPVACEKQSVNVPPGQDIFVEAYTGGGMAFAVFVAPGKQGIPPTVMVEQALMMMSMQAPQTTLHRWQTSTKQDLVFNGFTFTIPKQAVDVQQEAWVKQALGAGMGIQTGGVIALPGSSKYALGVVALGPKSREMEVENAVKMALSTVNFPAYKADKPVAGKAATLVTYKWPDLKAGQIALGGVVDTVSADRARMSLLVDQVMGFGQKPAKLNPARAKAVLSASLPDFVKPGARIIVCGKNTGQGQPINADSITPASVPAVPAAKP